MKTLYIWEKMYKCKLFRCQADISHARLIVRDKLSIIGQDNFEMFMPGKFAANCKCIYIHLGAKTNVRVRVMVSVRVRVIGLV